MVWRNSISGSSECRSVWAYHRISAADHSSREVGSGIDEAGSKARTELIKMSTSTEDTGFTIWCALIGKISIALKAFLIFFLISAFSLLYLNSPRKSPELIFVFLACCYSYRS